MNIETYIPLARRTESIPAITATDGFLREAGARTVNDTLELDAIYGTLAVRMLHAALGMVSELDELESAVRTGDYVNIGEELADVMWYWAIAVDSLPDASAKVDLILEGNTALRARRPSSNVPRDQVRLMRAISVYADMAKKLAFYRRAPDLEAAQRVLGTIVALVGKLMRAHRLSFSQQLKKNIEKLRVRFPEKFTEENANDRDLDAERKALEEE